MNSLKPEIVVCYVIEKNALGLGTKYYLCLYSVDIRLRRKEISLSDIR